jgi:hypothetical protein
MFFEFLALRKQMFKNSCIATNLKNPSGLKFLVEKRTNLQTTGCMVAKTNIIVFSNIM